MTTHSKFASVKVPLSLVEQAREAAQPLRRSAAGQIEYWATLGRVVEHSGLTVQEAQTAIEAYEAAGPQGTFKCNPWGSCQATEGTGNAGCFDSALDRNQHRRHAASPCSQDC